MHIVAAKAGDAVRIHLAGYEIVALHAILVRGAIRKMRERSLAEFVFLQLPEVRKVQTKKRISGNSR